MDKGESNFQIQISNQSEMNGGKIHRFHYMDSRLRGNDKNKKRWGNVKTLMVIVIAREQSDRGDPDRNIKLNLDCLARPEQRSFGRASPPEADRNDEEKLQLHQETGFRGVRDNKLSALIILISQP